MGNRDLNRGILGAELVRFLMILTVVLATNLPGPAGSQTASDRSAQLAIERAEVERAEAALAQGKIDLLRDRQLFEGGYVSEVEVARRSAEVEQLEADLDAARFSLRMTELAGTEPETTVVVPASPGIIEAIIDELPELPERSPFQ